MIAYQGESIMPAAGQGARDLEIPLQPANAGKILK
jgi:hypothetical protein